MSLQEKLINIQTELKAPKNHFNKFGNYHYRNCEDILEGVKPLLEKNKATLIIEDDLVLIGNRYYIKAKATLIDLESDTTISTTGFAREEENKKGMDSMQLTGATGSYARKYALNGLFCIDDTKDSDFTNKHGKEDKKTSSKGYNSTSNVNNGNKSPNSMPKTKENNTGENKGILVNFGKYSGMSLEKILQQDPKYVKWLSEKAKDQGIRQRAAELLKITNRTKEV